MIKPRSWPYLLVSILFLGMGIAGLTRQSVVAQLPADFPWDNISWPLTVAEVAVDSASDLAFLVEGLDIGTVVNVNKAGQQLSFVTVAAHSNYYMIVTTVSGLFFWLVAVFVFVPRLGKSAVAQFYWITMLYGLGILLGGVYFQFGLNILPMILNISQLGLLAFLPVVFLHMTLVFPKRILDRQLVRKLTISLYGIATLLVIWQGLLVAQYFLDPTPANAAVRHLPLKIADMMMVVQALLAFLIMLRQARKLEPGRKRQQARWLLVGFIVGATPYLFLRTALQLFSFEAPLPTHVDRLFEPAIPLAFVFAVVRYRFLDIDIILRRGILYGFLAAGMVALVLVPTALIKPERIVPWPLLLQTLPVLCGVLAGLLFQPLRKFLGRWIDRTFFRIEHRVDQILLELLDQLKLVSSQDDLAELVHRQINEALNPEQTIVMVQSVPEEIRIGTEKASDLTPLSCAKATAVLWAEADSSTCPELENPDFPNELSEQELVIGLQLETGDQPVGCILLGPKSIGHRYVKTDLAFLTDVAQAASRRLQEIRLVQTMTKEKLKRAQLDELNKLKDSFLLQVAHDLRTPVTSVGWSISNLLDGLAGELSERQREYLESMDNSLVHLNHLVASLLEISRLEKATYDIPTQMCALQPVLTRALDTIRPLAEAANVKMNCSVSDKNISLVTNEAKLTEVLVNILENGIRYAPSGSKLEVGVIGGEQNLKLTIRDYGPGFQDIGDPFVRFAQGQPSPNGSGGGYGLGLTIARENTLLMGGDIAARNHPEGGAEFTLELPTVNSVE